MPAREDPTSPPEGGELHQTPPEGGELHQTPREGGEPDNAIDAINGSAAQHRASTDEPQHPHGVRVVLAYDGTEFAGWQRQEGQRTVQQCLADAAARVSRHPVTVRGASRTDSGVHALGQVAAFATSRELSPRRWVHALNRYLPDDAAVSLAAPCPPRYDPRFDARNKTYRYLFHLGVVRDALMRKRAWHVGRHVNRSYPVEDSFEHAIAQLDLDAMHRAAERMVGTHDFRAFRAAADTRETTERTMLRVELTEGHRGNPALLELTVQGTAFMKNMVRIMAGTLLEVGRGRIGLEQLDRLLSAEGDRRMGGMTAPPEGLTLLSVTLGRLGLDEGRGEAPQQAGREAGREAEREAREEEPAR